MKGSVGRRQGRPAQQSGQDYTGERGAGGGAYTMELNGCRAYRGGGGEYIGKTGWEESTLRSPPHPPSRRAGVQGSLWRAGQNYTLAG